MSDELTYEELKETIDQVDRNPMRLTVPKKLHTRMKKELQEDWSLKSPGYPLQIWIDGRATEFWDSRLSRGDTEL